MKFDLKDFQPTSERSVLEQSIAAADWKTQLTEILTPTFQGSLPSIQKIETELSGDIATDGES